MDGDTARPGTRRRGARRCGPTGFRLGGVLLFGLLTAAACSGSPTAPGVAAVARTTTTSPTTVAGGASGSSGSSPSGQTSQDQQLQFSQCMRSHGVANFPDPSAGGGLLQAISAAGVNARSPAYQAALQACRQYTPAGTESPAQSAADNAAGLKFSQCMRSHGVANFPDPTMGPTGAPVINLRPEQIDPSSPTFQAANSACEKAVPGSK